MKYAIIIAIILLVSFAIWKAIPMIKRRKLAQGWAEIFKEAGMDMTEEALYEQFKKLDNSEIDKLATFSIKLKNKKYLEAFKMIKEVEPVLTKTNISFVVLLSAMEKLLEKKNG